MAVAVLGILDRASEIDRSRVKKSSQSAWITHLVYPRVLWQRNIKSDEQRYNGLCIGKFTSTRLARSALQGKRDGARTGIARKRPRRCSHERSTYYRTDEPGSARRITLPFPPESILRMEDSGAVVDLRTGAILIGEADAMYFWALTDTGLALADWLSTGEVNA